MLCAYCKKEKLAFREIEGFKGPSKLLLLCYVYVMYVIVQSERGCGCLWVGLQWAVITTYHKSYLKHTHIFTFHPVFDTV